MSKHLNREVEKLKKMLLALSAIVEESVHRAVVSIERRDEKLARKVIDTDIEIDHIEVDVEEECLKILALHQPVAIDLRFVISLLKINSDLERIGDHAVNIAEHAVFLASQPRVDIPFDMTAMAEKSKAMLKMSLDSLVNLDSALDRKVILADDEVDAMNREMYSRVEEAIRRSPEKIEILIHFLNVSRHLERLADHATNIAEDVIYMIDGEIIRHKTEEYLQKR